MKLSKNLGRAGHYNITELTDEQLHTIITALDFVSDVDWVKDQFPEVQKANEVLANLLKIKKHKVDNR